MRVTITRVSWHDHRDELLRIRQAVFVDEQGVPPELEEDEHDPAAIHLLAALPDGSIVATARLLADGRIGRMAVLADYRGRGIGSALMDHLLRAARRKGLARVNLYAQCRAVPFYERFGFAVEGEIFVDAGIDHQAMGLNIR